MTGNGKHLTHPSQLEMVDDDDDSHQLGESWLRLCGLLQIAVEKPI